MRATYSASTCGMHHMSLRQGLRSFSARRRRTVVARDTCMRGELDQFTGQKLQRPARTPGGRLGTGSRDQERFLFAGELAPARRGSSLSAASELPSTKRRLVRHTVEPPTPTSRAISSSLAQASAASKCCARLSLRAACLAPLNDAVSCSRSDWLSSTRYRTDSSVPPPGEARTNELNRMAGVSSPRKSFHAKQGQYLAFIHLYTRLHRRPNRHAAILPRQPALSAPDRCSPSNGQASSARQPRTPRSIELLVDPKQLHELL